MSAPRGPSKAVLLNAVRLLLEHESDKMFPIVETVLRNILIDRSIPEARAHLERIGRAP